MIDPQLHISNGGFSQMMSGKSQIQERTYNTIQFI